MNLHRLRCLVPRALLLYASFAISLPVEAANPNFSVIKVLPLTEAKVLLGSHFNPDALFGKQKGGSTVKVMCWMPTAADVAEAQDALYKYNQDNDFSFGDKYTLLEPATRASALTTDLRQYAGVTHDRAKLLLIAGNRNVDLRQPLWLSQFSRQTDNSRNHIVSFSDGGSNFQAAFNMARHEIVYLRVDGLDYGKLGR